MSSFEIYNNLKPQIANSAFIAVGSRIIGDVKIADNCSIWYNTVLRGDVDYIKIGSNTNIQDGSVVHTSIYNGPTNIGANVTIGHMALIHSCTIEDYAFIGMHSTIMDKARVEPYSMVAAGALISPGKIVKTGELWAGVPGKFIRKLTTKEIEHIKISSKTYVEHAKEYLKN